MQQPGSAHVAKIRLGHAELRTDPDRELGDPGRVTQGVRGFRVDHEPERLGHLVEPVLVTREARVDRIEQADLQLGG